MINIVFMLDLFQHQNCVIYYGLFFADNKFVFCHLLHLYQQYQNILDIKELKFKFESNEGGLYLLALFFNFFFFGIMVL